MANLSDIITPTNLVTLTGTDTLTNKTLTAPVLTTPNLGTPSALVLTNATGTLSSPTFVTPALGTPASGVMTSVTGLPLTTGVTGTLPVANGGTGATSMTANNVILGNGTSAVQVVAPGTSGNLLTSNGSTWASTAPAGGGALIFIQEVTASGATTATLNGFSSTYDSYQIEIVEIYGGNSAYLHARFTIGGSLITSGYNSSVDGRALSAGYSSSNNNLTGYSSIGHMVLSGSSMGGYDDNPASISLRLFNANTKFRSVVGMGSGNYGGQNNCQSIAGQSSSLGGSTFNSMQFFLSGGNTINGKFRLYGIVKS